MKLVALSEPHFDFGAMGPVLGSWSASPESPVAFASNLKPVGTVVTSIDLSLVPVKGVGLGDGEGVALAPDVEPGVRPEDLAPDVVQAAVTSAAEVTAASPRRRIFRFVRIAIFGIPIRFRECSPTGYAMFDVGAKPAQAGSGRHMPR